VRIRTRVAALAGVLALAACGDSTVLTGPQAEAAVAAAQAQVASGGDLEIRGLDGSDDRPAPVIYLDAERMAGDAAHAATILQAIAPKNIERIEVLKGCAAVGYFGDEGRGGAVLIYTKAHSGPLLEKPPYDEARAEAYCEELEEARRLATTPRWLYEAQQRHVRR